MPDILVIIIAIAGLASTCCALVLSYRNIKKTSPSTELKIWKAETEAKLDNDNRRLSNLEKSFSKIEEFDRVMLHSIKGILSHLSEEKHTDKMTGLIKEIDDYLINKI